MRYMFYKNRIRYTSFYNFWLVWKFLDFKRKSQFFILLILMLLSSLAEVLSIAAVIPFLDFLTNKEKIYQNTIVQNLFLNNSINNSTIIFTGLSLIFIFAIFFSGLLRIFNLYYSGKYTAIIGHQISRECYRRSLLQELEIHINRNSSVLISSITRHIDKTISLLNSLLLFIISSLNILFIYVGILVFDFELAITTALGFVAIYGIIVLFTGKRLRRNSLKVAECSTQQYKELQEGFGSYREILLENNQDLLNIVDFLITDWSSIYIDFLPLKKPIIFLDAPLRRKNINLSKFMINRNIQRISTIDALEEKLFNIYLEDNQNMNELELEIFENKYDKNIFSRYESRLWNH